MAVEKSGGGGGASSSSSSSAASTVDRFLKIVLSWDYLRLVADSKGSDQTKGLKYAKNSYASVAEYLGVFEPLLFEEVKAQIVQGRSSEEDEIGLDWQKGAVGLCTESEGFHKIPMAVPDGFREIVSENDLLLLSKEKANKDAASYRYKVIQYWDMINTLYSSDRATGVGAGTAAESGTELVFLVLMHLCFMKLNMA